MQVLGILKRQKLITIERVARDGTKIRANASKKSFGKADTIAESLAEAREHLAELEAAEEAEAQGRATAAIRRAKEREQRLEQALSEVEQLQREKRSHRKHCTPQNKMPKRGRTVSIRIPDERLQAFRKKMETEAAKEIYRERGQLAEFPNAWFKTKFRFTRFQSRDRKKAKAEAIWAALTYNLQRLFRLLPNWQQELARA